MPSSQIQRITSTHSMRHRTAWLWGQPPFLLPVISYSACPLMHETTDLIVELTGCAHQVTDILIVIFNFRLNWSLCVFQGHQHYASVKTVKHVLSQCLLAHSTHPIITKCFKSLVMRHIKIKLPISLNPLQFSQSHSRYKVIPKPPELNMDKKAP